MTTFLISSPSPPQKNTQNSTKGYRFERIINYKTKEKFRDALNEIQWTNVTCQSDVNLAYDLYLPVTRIELNRNIHKIKDFMTRELLISRRRKNELHKSYIIEPTQRDIYVSYRNIYNSVIRLNKKLYFEANLAQNKKT